ncbi:MAG: CRISPR-associated endoribonuclease Cas6 [Hydrogenothermaceae bacterium]|nr:CRISPR-associated endoribonuclease Cas6 [Hydrogenothermaceae bacterium]
MRVKVALKTDKIPMLYRHRMISLIKEALKKADREYKEFLYNNKITKPFTFNLSFPKNKEILEADIQIDSNFIVKDNVVIVKEGYLNLYVSSIDYRFLIGLVNGLKKLKTFNLSHEENMLVNGEKVVLEIVDMKMLNERHIQSRTVIFKTNSPILIEDKNDNPVIFSDKNFERELNEVTDRILRSEVVKGKGLYEPLKFEPIDMKKQVVKHTLKSFREKTGKPLMYLTGSSGVFKITGHPKDLEILYKIGIGNRTGQGFGMVEVL